mmetsp:Transcript_6786/g.16927  ORF Transcript_6786/g.16927 Transcript_6786/m.16927 type:complete len:236 (-) Transcript_6786:501-1208(-)
MAFMRKGRQQQSIAVSMTIPRGSSSRRVRLAMCLARHSVSRTLSRLKRAPIRPPATPMSRNTGISGSEYGSFSSPNLPKVISPGCDSTPTGAMSRLSGWKRGSHESSRLSVNVEQSAQKKVRHVSCCDQKEAASSMAKSTPPIGAPNAAATPAAAPADTKSRLSWSLRKRLRQAVRQPQLLDEPCERPAATIEPAWIIGPSLPTTSPLLTEKTTPTALQSSVVVRSSLGTLTPCR